MPTGTNIFSGFEKLAEALAPFNTAREVLADGKVDPGELSTLMRAAARGLELGADMLDKVIPPKAA